VDRTTPHEHPDSVMYTLSSFRRRLYSGGQQRDVEIRSGTTAWLAAQQHAGHNIGETSTHVIFSEVKDQSEHSTGASLGPDAGAVG
jgi:beta-alanine degradation protein BauB